MLEKAGATAVVPEVLEPSLQLAAAVLSQVGCREGGAGGRELSPAGGRGSCGLPSVNPGYRYHTKPITASSILAVTLSVTNRSTSRRTRWRR